MKVSIHSHRHVKPLVLSKYIDNELSASDRLGVEKALWECPHCHALSNALVWQNRSIAQSACSDFVVPGEVTQRIDRDIEARRQKQGVLSWAVRSVPSFAATFAAASVLLIASQYVNTGAEPQASPGNRHEVVSIRSTPGDLQKRNSFPVDELDSRDSTMHVRAFVHHSSGVISRSESPV